jgi:hypothetical protein
MSKRDLSIVSVEQLEKCIYLIRGEKVMLDEDLARLYLVRIKALVQTKKLGCNNPSRPCGARRCAMRKIRQDGGF